MPDGPRTATGHLPQADARLERTAALLRQASAVLLDFNGTLSLDEDLLEHCYTRALRVLSLPPMGSDEYAALLGRSERDIAEALLAARGRCSGSREPADTAALLAEVARAYADECARCPRIPASHRTLVHRLHELGIPLAIATGTLREMVTPVLVQTGLSTLIPVVVTIEDVTRGKPDPEGYLRAAGLLGVDVARAVVVEDSEAGISAGRSAGAATIGVGPTARDADLAIDHLGELTELF